MTTFDMIYKDIGLPIFLQKIYITTGISALSSIIISVIFSYFLESVNICNIIILQLIGLIIGLISIISFRNFTYKIIRGYDGYLIAVNSTERIISYCGIIFSLGITMSPAIKVANNISPSIIPNALILTFLTMASASYFARSIKENTLIKWKIAFIGLLSGIIGLSFISVISSLIIGNNLFSEIFHTLDTWVGLLMFAGFTAIETQEAVTMYNQGNPDHLGIAYELMFDFANLLIRFIHILSKRKKN